MKILGVVIILSALFFVTWWVVVTDHSNKPWAFFVGLVAIFAGVCFIVQDRAIEITIEKVGTIKAAAQQATIDAQAVAALRQRIEAQSATVDLVAESATKAHSLIEDLDRKNHTAESKIRELETAAAQVRDTLSKLRETADFMSLVAAAQNDDRSAFDDLVALIENKTSPHWQHAADTVVRIRTDFAGPIERGYMNVPRPDDTDPQTLPLALLRLEYHNAIRIYKADLVETVWKSKAINKRDKADFFIGILKDDNSLGATFLAGKYFVEATGDPNLKWSPFSTKPLIEWWEEHPDAFK